MKELDYGKGYKYAHNEAEGIADMECLPPSLLRPGAPEPLAADALHAVGQRELYAGHVRRGCGTNGPV